MSRVRTYLNPDRHIFLLLMLSTILLGAGFFAPAMTVAPGYGEFSSLVRFFKPGYLNSHSYSIVSAVWQLYAEGSYFIASLITLFSLLFPLWKLGVLWDCSAALKRRPELRRRLRLIEALGKFSMLDIFVMAVVVVAIKGLPGGTQVTLRWGVAAFTCSIMISLWLPHLLHRRAMSSTGDPS